MQRFAPASAAVLVAAFLLLHSSGAWAAEPTPGCGTSAHEAIASAQRALNNKSADVQRAAIVCLIQALTAVDARLHAVESGAAVPTVLIAPKSAGDRPR
jgi:hypothetical protein